MLGLGGCLLEGDLVAECFETAGELSGLTVSVAGLEVVGSEVVVGFSGGE